MSREVSVKIRLTEEIKEAFQTISNGYGMTMSGLGAYVIGSYVKQYNTIVNPLINNLGEKILDSVKEQMLRGKE